MTKEVDLMIGPHSIGPNDYHSEVSAMYGTSETKFAIAEEVKANVVKNVSAFLGCRDLLVNCVRELYARSNTVPNATRLLFYKQHNTRHTLIEKVSAAAKMLNSIERENKWRRTRVFSIGEVLENDDDEAQGCFTDKTTVYVRGSKMWIKNVYFYYMYIHILRAFVNDSKGILLGAKTLADFEKQVVTKRNSDGYAVDGLISHIRGIDYWPLVFQHRRDLFKGQTIKRLYVHENGTDGIHELTNSNAQVQKVKQRFEKLINAERMNNGR